MLGQDSLCDPGLALPSPSCKMRVWTKAWFPPSRSLSALKLHVYSLGRPSIELFLLLPWRLLDLTLASCPSLR